MRPVSIRRRNNRTYILLDRHLDIAQAARLHGRLGETLTPNASLVLNVGHVERIDTAVMQVLTAFCQTARTRAIPLQVHMVSESLRGAVALLGLPAFWENAASV